MNKKTESRKLEHVRLLSTRGFQYEKLTTMLEFVELEGIGGEIDMKDVDLNSIFLDKKINAPIMVSAMTGGHEDVSKINYDIAKAVSEIGIPMGLGSQRAMLENKKLRDTYNVKSKHDVILLGNIGLSQLSNYTDRQIKNMLEEIKADGLCIHTNPAQEIAQKEGTPMFKNSIPRIKEIVEEIGYHVIVKEVGNGISGSVAKKLSNTKIYGIDTGGAGGTNWVALELHRAGLDSSYKRLFEEWGIPTAQSIIEVKKNFKGKIIATGGIRTGLDVIRSIAIGADMCGIALPVLRAQRRGGSEEVERYIKQIIDETKIEMARLGIKNLKEVKKIKYKLNGKLSKIE